MFTLGLYVRQCYSTADATVICIRLTDRMTVLAVASSGHLEPCAAELADDCRERDYLGAHRAFFNSGCFMGRWYIFHGGSSLNVIDNTLLRHHKAKRLALCNLYSSGGIGPNAPAIFGWRERIFENVGGLRDLLIVHRRVQRLNA